ncbi:MAG: hypothetical protein EPN84_06845 [Legionella sp.]|nr:MAG: hypothetical protein EPN84_06845 [Legionella sp.]
MNRLRLYTIKLIAEVNPHFFKTADGQESFHQSVSWINRIIPTMRRELVGAAKQARQFVHVDKFPRQFAIPQHLSPRMMHQLFSKISRQFSEFEQFYTFNMKRFVPITNHDATTDSFPEENYSIEDIETVYQNILALVEETRAQLDQFKTAVSDIQTHAKVRYRLITSSNNPFNSRLTVIYNQLNSFEAPSTFDPSLNENNADDLNRAKSDLRRISAEARQVIEQTKPKNDVRASNTQFDCLAKLVKEFSDLCNVEEQKYSQAKYDVADPAASGLQPVKEKLTQLAKLHDELKTLEQANLEPNLYDMNSTVLVANIARLVLDICSLLNGQQKIGLPIFNNVNDLKVCVQFARYGFYHALLTQDLAKIQGFVNWFVRDLTETVDNRYFQGRRFQLLTTEQIPREFQQFIPSNWAPEDVNACLVQLDNLIQRIASLVLRCDQLETNQASEHEKSQVAAAQVFCLAKAGLLVRAIALFQGQLRILPREYSYSTQGFIGKYNPTQCNGFFADCSSRNTTPLLTYLNRTYYEPGGINHCMLLIDQMTKMDLEIALQEFVNLEGNLPSNDWTRMTPHVRSLVNQIARKHFFVHTELGPSFTNNIAQASLVLSLPGEASQAYFNLTSIMPTFEIGHFDEVNIDFIQYIQQVLWDLSQGQFRYALVDVFSALGNQGENMIGFCSRYAVTPDQMVIMNDVNRILGNLINWKSLTDSSVPESRLRYS